MSDESEKGRSLEKAVRLIQESIIKSDPTFKGIGFSIETNVRVTISGVLHEVDVLVKTLPGSLYEATWLFECKNWKEPVGKEQIPIFTDKVKALSANRGFLVAKRLSKYAKAQLKLKEYDRVSFVECRDDFLCPLDSIELIHSAYSPKTIEVRLKNRGVPASEHPETIDLKGVACRFNKKVVDFERYALQHVEGVIHQERNEIGTKYPLDGTYSGSQAVLIEFSPNEFQINGADIEYITLTVHFDVAIRRRKILSKFELKGQGRAFSFEPIDDFLPGKKLTIDIVQRL